LESSNLILIDYGNSKRYKDEFNKHIEFSSDVPFTGNVLFASKNAFQRHGKV